MDHNSLLLIGKVVAAHGTRGEVRVYSYVDEKTHLRAGRQVLIETSGRKALQYNICSVKALKKTVCIGLEGVDDRDAAEALKGSSLLMPRSALPPPEPDAWYWCDLIGLEVYDKKEGFIGTVDSMIETGANDVFVVKNKGAERLVPVVEHVVESIDPQAGRILVKLPEGL